MQVVIYNKRASACRTTEVIVLGAGVAGITAAQALSNASISDFIIVDRNDYIGGRMYHTTFGDKGDGTPYVVELGANWIQGLGAEDPGAPENPVWTFSKKWNVTNTYSDYDSILTYDETGANDYTHVLDEYDDASDVAVADAGYLLTENLQDPSARTGFSLVGWKPKQDMKKVAVEWWNWDWDAGYSLDQSSFVFGVTGDNLTFNQFGDNDNFVYDQQGFNKWLVGEASTFLNLQANDSRLLLHTNVSSIEYSDEGVTAYFSSGECVSASYAVCTFSLGVLQNDVVEFEPQLPRWKQEAIEQFQMGTYTKVFYQFNETFWPEDTQYFLYADPTRRGYYPMWQSLSTPGFLPGSNIIFGTVVDEESHRIEKQSDEQTKAEGLEVLRAMFPDADIPEPIAFMYPRWTTESWTHGSYSNWPIGMTLEKHQNLRANVGALWFAGEHTSAEYYGFLHGSWFEGREAGERIAALVKGNGTSMASYEVLHGTTPLSEYDAVNGWPVSSFVDYDE
ncbi:amine oxidase [Cryphonectria parasitica EP155]|uniref:Amine oxidase n=1 Tax=Cryphonectria parasitica (strain ATCC 38755 / EP155) TaxID=660469 RepID=A0A9P5CL25_CRYP1|nr:amine oxidase [Cryphonectria parasitica EP155]KAF3761586.1 amine oxidase [Cryphonectria parasitica EP155]